jgi:ABC-type transport system involved in cytochrome bd biosynthesis fused ATPase/permease subunit
MISKLSPNIRRSNLINYLVNDIKLIFNFIKSCGGIFGSISTLVFVQIFLLLEVGWFGLVLIVVFMLVGTAQRALYLKMSKTRNKKMSLVSERIGRNI